MAVQTHTISSTNDVADILRNHPPFNDSDAYTVQADGSYVYVKRKFDLATIASIYCTNSASSYGSNTGFTWYTTTGASFGISQTAGPTVAITTSKGVIFATHANPSTESSGSTAYGHYFTFMFAKDKNGNPAMACSGLGIHSSGYIYSSACGEVSPELSWAQVIRSNATDDTGWQFPRRSCQQLVTCPIATHPSSGTNYIDGGLLLLVTPVIPFGTVRIGNKNYATNGIMAISD